MIPLWRLCSNSGSQRALLIRGLLGRVDLRSRLSSTQQTFPALLDGNNHIDIRSKQHRGRQTNGGQSSHAGRVTIFERIIQRLSDNGAASEYSQRLSQILSSNLVSNLISKLLLQFDVIQRRQLLSQLGAVNLFNRASAKQQQNPNNSRNDDQGEQNNGKPDDGDKMPTSGRVVFLLWFLALAYISSNLLSSDDTDVHHISWNEFVYDYLAKGEVESITVRPESEVAFVRLHSGAVIRGKKAEEGTHILKIGVMQSFEEKLRKVEEELGIPPSNYVPVIYQRELLWVTALITLVIITLVLMLLKNVVKFQFPNPSEMFASQRKAKFVRVDLQTLQGKGVTFNEVAGLHEAKVEILEFVDYLKKPETYRVLGAKIPKGALLLGPPGCGKTLLAKAVATEARVPFLAMAGSEFVEMLGGLGAARVRDLFKEARQRAPCIIYIDEVDAIGRKRSGNNWADSSEEEHTLNQLLVEMDGIDTKEGVIVLASTNRAEILDKALLRPGRFDRHILIDYPTLAERKEIFEIYLKRLRLAKPATAYSEDLAQLSPGMSGADIANICNEAALHAARDKHTSIDTQNFEYAVERVTAGVAKKSRLLSVQEKRVVAFHEAGHAVVGWLLKHTDALMRVSIVPRTNRALGFAQYLPQERKLSSEDLMFENMCLMLGGRVAESLIFNSVTSGAQDDLQKVTKLAYDQMRLYGMNPHVGLVSFPPPSADNEGQFGSKPYSKQTARLIDEEARKLVGRAYRHTEALLQQNLEKLRAVAEALLEKEALSYKDMEQLIGPPPHGPKTVVPEWIHGAPASPVPPLTTQS